jgi:hypothetical protein
MNRPNTIQDLRDNIRADIARIPQDTLRKVMHSVTVQTHIQQRGG